MKFVSKPVEIEANQFSKFGECPPGVFTREDGSHYVTTAQGQNVNVSPGEWIVLESSSGDGKALAYPVKDEIFKKRYQSNASDLIRQLDIDEIRQRLDVLDRERKALLVFLRAAIRLRPSQKETK